MQKVGSQGPCCSEVHAAHMPVPSHQVVIPGTTQHLMLVLFTSVSLPASLMQTQVVSHNHHIRQQCCLLCPGPGHRPMCALARLRTWRGSSGPSPPSQRAWHLRGRQTLTRQLHKPWRVQGGGSQACGVVFYAPLCQWGI